MIRAFLFLILAAVCVPSRGQQLIVAYDFVGDLGQSTATDKSGFGTALNASLAPGAAIVSDPLRGPVLQTSASGFGAQTLYNSKLDFTTSFTLQAWVQPQPGGGIFQHIAGRPGAGPRIFNHWGLGALGEGQRTNPWTGGFAPVNFGPGGVSDGQWHHILLTWNHVTGSLTGYFDGA
ncbi:MAG TPA: hypothetical protein PKC18_16065, partial [Lacipirellulaceae bacterium]|nr:hypothetical protein [Lacipirellulaceae bacterium]